MEQIDVQKETLALVARTKTLAVVDTVTYSLAGEALKDIKTARARIAEVFDPDIKRWNDGHKQAIVTKNQFDKPLADLEIQLRRQRDSWRRNEEQKRKEEELRLQAEARAAEEARRLVASVELELSGDSEAAQEILEAPAFIPAPIIPKVVPREDGVSVRTEWTFEITDESLIPREYLVVDITKIRGVVRAMKQQTEIPGIRVFERTLDAIKI